MNDRASDLPNIHVETGYQIISTAAELDTFLAGVAGATEVGLDLEADNLHHYQEQLCLIQLHAAGRNALIDPLAIDDLGPLMAYLDDPHRELWMHGADFDMSLFLADLDWLPARILDTQIAAQIVGHRRFGLASLADHFLGIAISKSSQKEDWSRRPLPDKMCEYAARDAAVLLPLKDLLLADLHAKGRHDWFLQTCRHARRQALAREPRDADDLWRIQGWGSLKGREMAYLRALWHWRDEEAQRRDVPTFKVLANHELLAMSRQLEAEGKAHVRRRLSRQAREALARLTEEVAALPQSAWPERRKKTRKSKPASFDARFDALKARRDQAAEALAIDPTVIAPRRTLELLALGDDAEDQPDLLPWQEEIMRA